MKENNLGTIEANRLIRCGRALVSNPSSHYVNTSISMDLPSIMFLPHHTFCAALRFARLCGLALVFLVPVSTTVLAAQLVQAAEAPETNIVLVLQDGLVEILGNQDTMATHERSVALTKLVEGTFDINAMGAVAVGLETYRNWSDAQRADFLEAFARFMVATHASRFEGVRNPEFEIEGSEDARAGRKIIHSRYLHADKDPVSIDYLVRSSKEGWRVLDVYLDGTISLLALHRSEFASVLRTKGFDGFIAAMNAKADELNPG